VNRKNIHIAKLNKNFIPKTNHAGKKIADFTILKYQGAQQIFRDGNKSGLYSYPVYLVKCACGRVRNQRISNILAGKSTKCWDCRFKELKTSKPTAHMQRFKAAHTNWKGSADIPGKYLSGLASRARQLVMVRDLK